MKSYLIDSQIAMIRRFKIGSWYHFGKGATEAPITYYPLNLKMSAQ